MRKLVIVPLIVKTLLILILFGTENVHAMDSSKQSFVWQLKTFDSGAFEKYDFSKLDSKIVRKVKNDFKSTPYNIVVDGLNLNQIYDQVLLENAWISKEKRKVYLSFSIYGVLETYVIYEIEGNNIIDKYFVSSWNNKKGR